MRAGQFSGHCREEGDPEIRGKRIRRRNVDGRLQVQLEKHDDGIIRQNRMNTCGLCTVIYWGEKACHHKFLVHNVHTTIYFNYVLCPMETILLMSR